MAGWAGGDVGFGVGVLVTAGVSVGIGVGDVAAVAVGVGVGAMVGLAVSVGLRVWVCVGATAGVGVGVLVTSNEKSTSNVLPASTLFTRVNSPEPALKLSTNALTPFTLASIAGGHTNGVTAGVALS